jgi:hypothetical protein
MSMSPEKSRIFYRRIRGVANLTTMSIARSVTTPYLVPIQIRDGDIIAHTAQAAAI